MAGLAKFKVIAVFGVILSIGILGFGVYLILGSPQAGSNVFNTSVSILPVSEGHSWSIEPANSVEFEGVWEIKVLVDPAAVPTLKVGLNEEDAKIVELRQEGGKITVSQNRGNHFVGSIPLQLTLASIENLRVSGLSSLVVSGSEVEKMGITVDGGSSVRSEAMRIREVVIKSEGANSIDFSTAGSALVHLNAEGVGEIKLGLDNGDVSGSVRGIVTVTLNGSVKTNTLVTEGLSKVVEK